MKTITIRSMNALLNAALKWRGEPHDESNVFDKFDSDYGICHNFDNLSRIVGHNMTNLKNNVVCLVPSFSGNYHYPVKSTGTEYSSPERAHDNLEQWANVYGANRIQLLREVIEYCETHWSDDIFERRTQAERRGFRIGDIYEHTTTGEIWEFEHDDDSGNPEFKNIITLETQYVNLDYLKPVDKTVCGTRKSVKSIVSAHTRNAAKMKLLKGKIAQIEKELHALNLENIKLDIHLRSQHGVKIA